LTEHQSLPQHQNRESDMNEQQRAVVQQALAKVRAAQQCHPNFVMTLLCEADELMEQLLEQQEPEQPVQEPLPDAVQWYGGVKSDEELAPPAAQPDAQTDALSLEKGCKMRYVAINFTVLDEDGDEQDGLESSVLVPLDQLLPMSAEDQARSFYETLVMMGVTGSVYEHQHLQAARLHRSRRIPPLYTTPPAQPTPVRGFIKKIEDLIQERDDARSSLDFYKRRADALQQWQSKMRDPERTIVCDILANGCTLEPAGDRYTTPPAQPAATTGDPFLQGVCVALQAVTGGGDGVLWREIVEAAGADDLFQYAAHIEPEEWELAGFAVFAESEMGRRKPRRLTAPPAQPAVPEGSKLVKMQPHELAEQMYLEHPTYCGTKPLQWREAPNETRREWLDKANAMLAAAAQKGGAA